MKIKEDKEITSTQENNKTEAKPLHKSVMTTKVLQYLDPKPGKIYVDATFGCGGHTEAILEKEPNCTVVAIDLDKTTLDLHVPKFKEKYEDRFKPLWGNFSNLYKLLKKINISKVDGILADFGTSQLQITQKEGFSFRIDTPLDMRMSKAHSYFNAAYVVNKFSERQLSKIFFELGEERQSRRIARAIVERRKIEKIETTKQLADLVEEVVFRAEVKKRHRHPATKVFQALRIHVNKELESISLFLPIALGCLKKDGKLVCISFHSLEDRLVKIFFKENQDKLKIITPKPITPSEEEVKTNASSRSSKLRVAQKIIK